MPYYLNLDPRRVTLSIIVPAYNESLRLPKMLEETIDFLQSKSESSSGFTYEIIVVDDGSKDNTKQVAAVIARQRQCGQLRVLVMEKNRGKGGAVTQGMLVARGRYIMFADADGASKISGNETNMMFLFCDILINHLIHIHAPLQHV